MEVNNQLFHIPYMYPCFSFGTKKLSASMNTLNHTSTDVAIAILNWFRFQLGASLSISMRKYDKS